MNQTLILRICLGLVMLLCGKSYADRFQPRFFSKQRQHRQVAKQEAVRRFADPDKSIKHTLFLLSDGEGRPLLFYADITTAVCMDNVCEPVRIGLYWNLVGDYVGYGVPPDCPLLKYDHVPFAPGDYLKLHQVLSDRQSILGRGPLAEMLDPNVPAEKRKLTYGGETVDAVSRATLKDISPSIVPGALYSCYAIWHLAHGDAKQQMADYLQSVYGPALARRLLYSENVGYQIYAVQRMNDGEINGELPRLLEIVQQSGPAARACVFQKLPEPIWRQESTTRSVYSMFATLRGDMKALLIEKLDHAHASAADILSDQVESMTKKQLKGYLAFLADDPNRLTGPIKASLRRIATAERYAYCYVVDAFLRDSVLWESNIRFGPRGSAGDSRIQPKESK